MKTKLVTRIRLAVAVMLRDGRVDLYRYGLEQSERPSPFPHRWSNTSIRTLRQVLRDTWRGFRGTTVVSFNCYFERSGAVAASAIVIRQDESFPRYETRADDGRPGARGHMVVWNEPDPLASGYPAHCQWTEWTGNNGVPEPTREESPSS